MSKPTDDIEPENETTLDPEEDWRNMSLEELRRSTDRLRKYLDRILDTIQRLENLPHEVNE